MIHLVPHQNGKSSGSSCWLETHRVLYIRVLWEILWETGCSRAIVVSDHCEFWTFRGTTLVQGLDRDDVDGGHLPCCLYHVHDSYSHCPFACGPQVPKHFRRVARCKHKYHTHTMVLCIPLQPMFLLILCSPTYDSLDISGRSII